MVIEMSVRPRDTWASEAPLHAEETIGDQANVRCLRCGFISVFGHFDFLYGRATCAEES